MCLYLILKCAGLNTYGFSIFRRIKTVKQHQMKMITSLLSNGPDE